MTLYPFEGLQVTCVSKSSRLAGTTGREDVISFHQSAVTDNLGVDAITDIGQLSFDLLLHDQTLSSALLW